MNKSTRNDWLKLVETPQKNTLARLLETAPRSKGEFAHQMLGAPPWPTDADDARARLDHVISYLSSGYRVGDPHPTMEETDHE